MPVVATEFGQVEYLEFGTGEDLVLLFHSAAGSPRALSRLAPLIAETEWRVIAPAHAGYGETRVEGEDNPLLRHQIAARWSFNRFEGRCKVLIGHSLGGLVSLCCTREGLPADALVLVEPAAYSILDETDPGDAAAKEYDRKIIGQLQELYAAGKAEEAVAAFVEPWNETAWRDLPELARQMLIDNAGNLAAELRVINALTATAHDYASIRQPVLLMDGGQSPDLARRVVANLGAALPGARLVTIEEAGHMGPVLRPHAFATPIIHFLDEVRRWPQRG